MKTTNKPAKFTLQKILPSLSFLSHMSVSQTLNTLSSLLHPSWLPCIHGPGGLIPGSTVAPLPGSEHSLLKSSSWMFYISKICFASPVSPKYVSKMWNLLEILVWNHVSWRIWWYLVQNCKIKQFKKLPKLGDGCEIEYCEIWSKLLNLVKIVKFWWPD